MNKFAPERCHHPITNPDSWITNNVKEAINKRDKLFQMWVCNPTDENHHLFKKQRHNITTIFHRANGGDTLKTLKCCNPTATTLYRTLKTQ